MTVTMSLYDRVQAAAGVVRGQSALVPEIGIILGTGLGGLAREIAVEAEVPYAEIPGFPLSTVETHAGRLLLGRLGGRPVVAMQGRFHRYEGYDLQQVTFPVRVLHALGARTLIVSNACGGMNPLWGPGDLVLLSDHINLLGDNPLVGPNDERLGPRFPDMSAPYDPELRTLARKAALELGIVLREGVYVAVPGPNLETRAEYRMLRAMGADVVGMSTVPEVIVAGHQGMRDHRDLDHHRPVPARRARAGRHRPDHRDRRPGGAAPHPAHRRAGGAGGLMAYPTWPDLGADQLEQQLLARWKAEGLFRQTLEAGRGGAAVRVLRGAAHGQRPPGHPPRLRADDQGPDLPLSRDAGAGGHPHRGLGHPRAAGRDRGREGAQAQRQEGNRAVRRGGVQRPRARQRLQVPERLGDAVRPDRLLARLRASVRHVQQGIHRDGVVAAPPAARAGPALSRAPGAAVLPALRHGALEPRARAGLRGGHHQFGVRDLPARRRPVAPAAHLDHDALDAAEQRGRGGAAPTSSTASTRWATGA